jgi:hypothetical protein
MGALHSTYVVCALLGGTLFVCQLILGMLGLGGHHDLGGDSHDIAHEAGGGSAEHGGAHAGAHGDTEAASHASIAALLLGLVSFRSIVAFLTFFGMVGWATQSHGRGVLASLSASLPAGLVAMFVMGMAMRSLRKIDSEGNVQVRNAIGKEATVYLTIPARKSGDGKITINLQDRTMEYRAVTSFAELPTGSRVVVVDVLEPDLLEVVSASEEGSHFNV